jgi:2'-5' RNA ligase
VDNKTSRFVDKKKVALLLEKLGYPVFEYLLIIKPPEDILVEIQKIKENFAKEYQHHFAAKTSPHITIAMFGQYESKEKAIINKLKELVGQLSEFKIELNGFRSYPSHTIYIDVKSKALIMNAVNKIKQGRLLMKMNNSDKPFFTNDPHLSIARKLLPFQYEKAWVEYEHKNFVNSFLANEMILLKRPVGGSFIQVATFPFKNLPIGVQQGVLF